MDLVISKRLNQLKKWKTTSAAKRQNLIEKRDAEVQWSDNSAAESKNRNSNSEDCNNWRPLKVIVGKQSVYKYTNMSLYAKVYDNSS